MEKLKLLLVTGKEKQKRNHEFTNKVIIFTGAASGIGLPALNFMPKKKPKSFYPMSMRWQAKNVKSIQEAGIEYAEQGVQVNAINPGFIKTPLLSPLEEDEEMMQALVALYLIGRLGKPEEVAEMVVLLSSEKPPLLPALNLLGMVDIWLSKG